MIHSHHHLEKAFPFLSAAVIANSVLIHRFPAGKAVNGQSTLDDMVAASIQKSNTTLQHRLVPSCLSIHLLFVEASIPDCILSAEMKGD